MISVSPSTIIILFSCIYSRLSIGKGTEKTVKTMSRDVESHSVGKTRLQHPCIKFSLQLLAYIIYLSMHATTLAPLSTMDSSLILHPYIWPGQCINWIFTWKSASECHMTFVLEVEVMWTKCIPGAKWWCQASQDWGENVPRLKQVSQEIWSGPIPIRAVRIR